MTDNPSNGFLIQVVALRIIWHRILRAIWHNRNPLENRDTRPASFQEWARKISPAHSQSKCEGSQNSSQGCYLENIISRMFFRNVSPSTRESVTLGGDPLESGRFREWNCFVNFLPTLLVSINCDAISATTGKYSTIDVRHF